MAFGQQSGPPATARQLQELLGLLHAAGHEHFRDARGPLGFTQRQAAGKFTREEAEAFIDQLQSAAEGGEVEPVPTAPVRPARSTDQRLLRTIPTEDLAAELQRRGWVVLQP